MGSSESKHHQKGPQINGFAEELEKSSNLLTESAVPRDATDGKACSDKDPQCQFTRAGSKSDPSKLRSSYLRSQSIVDKHDVAALQIDPAKFKYPFVNLVMEGGGNKGMAYVGALKCLEEVGIMPQIKKMAGASAGAITVALTAFGYTSDEVLGFLSQDLEAIIMDHSCGYFSLLPNLVKSFGWNPGHKIYDWFGQAIEKKAGDPDATFRDLYKMRGIELCIVVTNLNLMTAQYCHPKTTPNMAVRDALRMTMAIPGVFSAVNYDNHGVNDVFVDGGVLVNYPINCFDGWYLSMAKEDAFLSKMKSLEDLPAVMCPANRFKPTGPNQTLGFLLFADPEREIMRFDLESRYGTLLPEKPKTDTPLWLAKQEKKRDQEKAQRAHRRIVFAVENFLGVLCKSNDEDPEYISREELKETLENPAFLPENKEILFGKDCQLDKAFKILDKDGNNKIAFYELIQFIEERGIRMQVRFQGYNRREVNSLPAFLMALQETLLTNLKYTAVNEKDTHRTVGINTGHIETLDYNLEEDDVDFIVARGRNATMSFLRYYAAEHPENVKPRETPANINSHQPKSIHSAKCNGTPVDSSAVDDKDVLLEEKKA